MYRLFLLVCFWYALFVQESLTLGFYNFFGNKTPKCSSKNIHNQQNKSLGKLAPFHRNTIKGMLNDRKIIYISIDLCDGSPSNFDTALFHYLEREHIPAMVFVTRKWCLNNGIYFNYLVSCPLISIQNHGKNHLVPSYQKKTVYGVPCVKDSAEVVEEIVENYKFIYEKTGQYPTLYRPATIYHDDLAIRVCHNAGMYLVAYTFTTYNGEFKNRNTKVIADSINKNLCNGAIILLHGNHRTWNEKDVLVRIINHATKNGYKIGHYTNNTDVLSTVSCSYPDGQRQKAR